MSKSLFLAALCMLLTACGRQATNAEADEKVLCDPSTGKAYYVRPGAGDVSFVRPVPTADALCKKA